MNAKYVMPQNDLWCWKSPLGIELYYTTRSEGYKTNQDGLTIIELCNGKRTIHDIINILSRERTLTDEDVEIVKNFIDDLVSLEILQTSSVSTTEEIKIQIIGEENSFHAIHSTVELCDACNLECLYCYREASPSRKIYLRKPLEFLSDLYEQGIRVIELSGGEPLLHPQIYDIIEFACNKFSHVSLLSNGILLDTKLLDLMENYREKFILQISVPSINRTRFQKITGKDKWNALHNKLLLLKNRNIMFRIGMVFYDKQSINELRDAAYLAQSLGALQFAVNPFINLGRAKELLFSTDTLQEIYLKLEEMKHEFSTKFLGIVEGGRLVSPTRNNCGAGYRSIVVNPEGKLRPCPMFPADEFSCFALRQPEIRKRMSQIVAPRASMCGSCQFLAYCHGCFLRGAMKFKETRCTWGMSQDIESVLASLRSHG